MAGSQFRNPPVQLRRDYMVIDQHPVCPNLAPARTLTSEMVPFGSKSVTLSMWIAVVENVLEFDRIN